MLRRATNLTVAKSFQPCMVGEAVTAKSYRQLLFLCYKQKADIEGGSKLYSLASALAFGGFTSVHVSANSRSCEKRAAHNSLQAARSYELVKSAPVVGLLRP
jgi:hypothetical protein